MKHPLIFGLWVVITTQERDPDNYLPVKSQQYKH